MKFICEQNDLSTNLSLVSRAVPSRPTHPVLGNVLLTADEDSQRVSLTAFDLSLGIRTSFAAQVEDGGTLTLPAKLLNDIISRLPNGQIKVDDEAEEYLATITSSFGRYQVRGMGAQEYPELPAIENGQTIYLAAETLIAGLHGTLFATSADETKQILTGVHLTLIKDGLEFAATDGHRLAMVETFHQQPENEDDEEEDDNISETDLNVTVPARALREVERILGMRQGQNPDQPVPSVGLSFDGSQVVFEWGDQRLTTRLLEGQFPTYRQLLPKAFIRNFTLDRKQFLSAIERISVFADQKNNIVKANLDNDSQKLTLSVEAKDVGSGQESIAIELSGESIDIAFNVKYLMESLKNLNTPQVQVELNQALSPVVIKPLGGWKATHLIMPVQVRA
ncbi:DNA polymerase III subunit beta [Aerosakkonema funiforme]|uniref:Beta sliding clamp n=1 Tax=Aerosakkonema funiforme FACHB-1375 TaxID=2949571 RepID=A0A926ZLA1_9CYAN|nr:DNA polymerase III subunit beta [Aerosakkonema funiforme]MBD2186504.1 DNA polymerase III subunit beta [Aerosakkonema funiforme FACHB-1375]